MTFVINKGDNVLKYFDRKIVVQLLAAILYVIFAYQIVFSQKSYANDSLVQRDTIDNAISIAKKISAEKLVITDPVSIKDVQALNVPDLEKLKLLRFLIMDSLFREGDSTNQLLSNYRTLATELNSQRDLAIAQIIDLQIKLQTADPSVEPAKSDLQLLRNFRQNEDWFVAQRAALMESTLPTYVGNFDVAFGETQDALEMIPSELSDEASEALYETYDQIAFLQLLLNNIEFGINTTAQVIEKGLEDNRQINGIGLINNMIYAFNSWQEYETAEKLSEILVDISSIYENSSSSSNSLIYYRLGQAQNNAGHFDKALISLNTAYRKTSDAQLKLSIESARAISYAGLGQHEQTKQSLANYQSLSTKTGLESKNATNDRIRAESLLAVNKGDAEAVWKLQNTNLKKVTQGFLLEQAKGIQSLQANLENDKNRVAEREAALIRETELKQSELEAKQRSNVFLMALAGSLLLIAAAAIGFAVWRQKISKILEIAAHDAEAGDRAKSQFLSVMSHELRTPLNGIIGIAGILSEKGETEELRNYNRLILKSGENLLELLSGILDMAQMESGKLSIVTAPASIRQIIDGLYQAARKDVDEGKVQFTCFVSENIPDDLMLDSIRVKQALSNLLSNAVRFTDQGRIHIHTTMTEPNKNGVRELTMIVADTGRGITDEVKSKLFKPFVQADSSLTRSHDGAGIGLAVTRGLSRLMGGDVTMTSTAGRGSEFKMVIKTCVAHEADFDAETNRPVFEVVPSASTKIDFSPAVSIEKLRADEKAKEKAKIQEDLYGTAPTNSTEIPLETPAEPVEFGDGNDVDFETIGGTEQIKPEVGLDTNEQLIVAEPDNPRSGFSRNHPRSDTPDIEPDQLSGLNILVVEDIEANLEIMCSLLEPVGCSVSCAENGQIAVDMMSSQTFDAVLMDIRMPVLDGIEATKAIRALPEPQCNTAIIALTADASAENNAECLAAGADVFLTKPVIVSELFSSIRFARRKQLRQKKQARHALSA